MRGAASRGLSEHWRRAAWSGSFGFLGRKSSAVPPHERFGWGGAASALYISPRERCRLPPSGLAPAVAGLGMRYAASTADADTKQDDADALAYADSMIKRVLSDVRTIAVVGASANTMRPSYFAMKYLQAKGYRVIPINPGSAGNIILGEHTFKDLLEMDAAGIKADMVDVFQRSDRVPPIADDAIRIGASVLWLQLGVRNAEAAARAEAAGLTVIQDRCPKIEFSRLFGELGWHGFNSGVISSKRRPVGSPGNRSEVQPPAGKADENKAEKADGELPDLEFRGFDTRAIHAGASPDAATGARSTPIYQTTAYVFEDADHAASLFNLQTFGNIYSRLSNPTVSVLEERLANLEGGRGATCTASGHAAQFLAIFALLQVE